MESFAYNNVSYNNVSKILKKNTAVYDKKITQLHDDFEVLNNLNQQYVKQVPKETDVDQRTRLENNIQQNNKEMEEMEEKFEQTKADIYKESVEEIVKGYTLEQLKNDYDIINKYEEIGNERDGFMNALNIQKPIYKAQIAEKERTGGSHRTRRRRNRKTPKKSRKMRSKSHRRKR